MNIAKQVLRSGMFGRDWFKGGRELSMRYHWVNAATDPERRTMIAGVLEDLKQSRRSFPHFEEVDDGSGSFGHDDNQKIPERHLVERVNLMGGSLRMLGLTIQMNYTIDPDEPIAIVEARFT
jgi:hypothetical protein